MSKKRRSTPKVAVRYACGVSDAYKEGIRDSEVTTRLATPEELRRMKVGSKSIGSYANTRVKQGREPYDKLPPFQERGSEELANEDDMKTFLGGEGGRGWTVRSTKI